MVFEHFHIELGPVPSDKNGHNFEKSCCCYVKHNPRFVPPGSFKQLLKSIYTKLLNGTPICLSTPTN